MSRNYDDPIYKKWRLQIYERDKFKCQWPGCNITKKLNNLRIRLYNKYYENGYINTKTLIYVPFLFAIGLIGSYIGKRLLVHIPQTKFKNLSLFFILIIGIVSIGKQFF
jgi:hypothetical protein